MRIVSLDLSLTRTGWATSAGACGVLTPPKGRDRDMARLAWIRDEVVALVRPGLLDDADLVVIEGYSFGQARGSSNNHALGELGGVVRLTLHEIGVPYVDVPPASLKKYATGKGNAGKELVLVEAVKRLGYQGSDNNEADACWLVAMAQDQYCRRVIVPKSHREALAKVKWPAINTPKPTSDAPKRERPAPRARSHSLGI